MTPHNLACQAQKTPAMLLHPSPTLSISCVLTHSWLTQTSSLEGRPCQCRRYWHPLAFGRVASTSTPSLNPSYASSNSCIMSVSRMSFLGTHQVVPSAHLNRKVRFPHRASKQSTSKTSSSRVVPPFWLTSSKTRPVHVEGCAVRRCTFRPWDAGRWAIFDDLWRLPAARSREACSSRVDCVCNVSAPPKMHFRTASGIRLFSHREIRGCACSAESTAAAMLPDVHFGVGLGSRGVLRCLEADGVTLRRFVRE